MALHWKNSTEDLDWSELEALYRRAPLGNKSADSLQTVFGNSRYKWFAREDGRLVAAGRALADGADCSYLCDVAVLPSHQGSSVGKEVVSRLVADSKAHKKIILYSVPGKEDFYRKLGFLRLLTAMAIFEDQEAAIERGHLGAACASTPESAHAQVWAAERAFARTMADRDLDTFGQFVAEDAVFFAGTTALRGQAKVIEAWAAFFKGPAAPFSWAPDQVEVLDSGTLALSTGPVRDPGGTVVARFNSIWRLEGSGRWRVVFDKGSPPSPGPTP
jgi:ketosteroid isomerase-like protein/N-acetylglutamate synthase-like GNAT family acetyltransferase